MHRLNLISILAISFTLPLLLLNCCATSNHKEEAEGEEEAPPTSISVHNISSDLIGHLSYSMAGDPQGRRVIFIHGTPGSRSAWDGYMEQVPAGRQYLAIDRPAFGDSGSDQVISIWKQAAIIEELLMPDETAGLPIIVGHSYGGTLAAVLAGLYPDQVGAIVIVAGSVSPYLDNQRPLFKFFAGRPWRYLVPRNLNKANDEVIALEEEAKLFPQLWKEIRAPIFVLQGSKDPLVSVDNVDYMRQEMTNAPLNITVLEGANHFLIWNSVTDVNRLIDEAIASIQ